MAWLNQTLAGMEAARMNVLHLHLSDFCRFALDLPEFPQVPPQEALHRILALSVRWLKKR